MAPHLNALKHQELAVPILKSETLIPLFTGFHMSRIIGIHQGFQTNYPNFAGNVNLFIVQLIISLI